MMKKTNKADMESELQKPQVTAEPKTEALTEPNAEAEREQPKGMPTVEGTRVWCGPSIRNVTRQYTVYAAGKLPDGLAAVLAQHPEAKGLLVSVERFAETRRRLDIKGTAEAVLYEKVKSNL